MLLDQSQEKKRHISLTPLIDVVFILLIFFMLASTFVKLQQFPLNFSETDNEHANVSTSDLIIIEGNDQYSFNGEALPYENIQETIANNLLKKPDHNILVQSSENATVQDLVSLLERLKPIAGTNLSIIKGDEQ